MTTKFNALLAAAAAAAENPGVIVCDKSDIDEILRTICDNMDAMDGTNAFNNLITLFKTNMVSLDSLNANARSKVFAAAWRNNRILEAMVAWDNSLTTVMAMELACIFVESHMHCNWSPSQKETFNKFLALPLNDKSIIAVPTKSFGHVNDKKSSIGQGLLGDLVKFQDGVKKSTGKKRKAPDAPDAPDESIEDNSNAVVAVQQDDEISPTVSSVEAKKNKKNAMKPTVTIEGSFGRLVHLLVEMSKSNPRTIREMYDVADYKAGLSPKKVAYILLLANTMDAIELVPEEFSKAVSITDAKYMASFVTPTCTMEYANRAIWTWLPNIINRLDAAKVSTCLRIMAKLVMNNVLTLGDLAKKIEDMHVTSPSVWGKAVEGCLVRYDKDFGSITYDLNKVFLDATRAIVHRNSGHPIPVNRKKMIASMHTFELELGDTLVNQVCSLFRSTIEEKNKACKMMVIKDELMDDIDDEDLEMTDDEA